MPAKTRLIVGHKADKGLSRDVMEDSYGFRSGLNPDVLRKGALFIVADGVGGNQDGEIASRMAVEIITREFYSSPSQIPAASLEQAIITANVQICAAARAANSDMATTIVCAVVYDGGLTVAHVGDSRAYLLRGRELLQLTLDHSLVNEQVRQGMINNQEAQASPFRNVITRSLGNKTDVLPEIYAHGPVQDGERLLLCSDGVYDGVPPEKIREALTGYSPAESSERLVDLANDAGGSDNISVIVVEMHPETTTESGRTASQPPASEVTKTEVTPPSDSWLPPAQAAPTLEVDKTYIPAYPSSQPVLMEAPPIPAAYTPAPEGAEPLYQWTIDMNLDEAVVRGGALQRKLALPDGRTLQASLNFPQSKGSPPQVLIKLKIGEKEINRYLTSYEIIIDAAKFKKYKDRWREAVFAQEGELIPIQTSDPRIFAVIRQVTLANPGAPPGEPAGLASLNVRIFIQTDLQP